MVIDTSIGSRTVAVAALAPSGARRVVYVTDGLSPWVIGGMQTVARRHVGWLVEAGYHVTVVHGMADDVQLDDVDMVRVPWPGSSRLGKLNPWKYAGQLRQFSRGVSAEIDRVAPALIYAEGPVIADYLARPKADRARTVFHPHGLEMFQTLGSRILDLRVRPLRALMRHHALQSDRVITQGGKLTQILTNAVGVSTAKLAYLPNCLPVDFPEAPTPRAGHRARFLFVGRPEPRKGLPLLLHAFRQVQSGATTLSVVGSSAGAAEAPNNVTFHGAVRDKTALVKLFDASDVLVVPSYSEGMATVILEAFGRAMPVIGTDVGATRDLVRPGTTGWLIPPGDRDALEGALREAGDLDNSRYAEMSLRALDLVTGEYSSQHARALFLSVIADLVDARFNRNLRGDETIKNGQ
jgi:glycosyltransferase involved in cell wall biosynthesis